MDQLNDLKSTSELTDFEIQKLTKFFDILLAIKKRRQKQDDLRTDKSKESIYN